MLFVPIVMYEQAFVALITSAYPEFGVNTNKCSPLFLSFQFSLSRDLQHQIARVSSGAVMAGINVSKLKKVSVMVPPIGQQRQFKLLVVKQKGLQMQLTNSQGKGSDLFASLQQRAFRGKL